MIITLLPLLSASSILTLFVSLISKLNGSRSHIPSSSCLLLRLILISLTSKFAPEVSILPALLPLLIILPLTFVKPPLFFMSLHITIVPPCPFRLDASIKTLSSTIVLFDCLTSLFEFCQLPPT